MNFTYNIKGTGQILGGNFVKFHKFKFLIVLLIFVLVVAGCSDSDDNSSGNESDGNTETGGELNIALNASPPSLDQPATAAAATRDTAMLMYETLVTVDSEYKTVPMLAETIDLSDDGKEYTFHLREGVKFHNGKEMIAEDVIASMERWLEQSSLTGNIFVDATWEAEDDYTVVLTLAAPSALTLDTLATTKQAPAIMPKEIIESAPAEGVEEYVGTGPFKFVEWKQDQYIHFTKYEDYQPVEMEASGLSGKKEALVDDIFMHIVSDTSTRIAGLQSGEYDFAYDIPYDNYEQLDNDPNLETLLVPSANAVLKFNNVEGIGSDFKLREAINTGLDLDEIMMAAFPNKDFYWLAPGYMDVNLSNWASDAGSEYYNQNDPEKAKEMLEDMGYDGEEFRILATRDYDYIYSLAVVLHEQLTNMGINSKLEIFDWPTLSQMTENENELGSWDATISGSSIVSTPPQLISLSPSWAGGVNDSFIVDTMEDIELAKDHEEAKELWDTLQLYAWEEHLPTIQLGGFSKVYSLNNKIKGVETLVGPIFWNVTVEE